MALRCRVILLPREGSSSFRSWEEVLDESTNSERTELPDWYETMVSLADRARVKEKKSCEVVLCMLGDQLAKRWDHHLLKLLLQNARESCWGAPLFLVVSRDIRPDRLTRQRASVDRWLKAALAGRVFDLLQLSYDPECGVLPEDSDLRLCCDEALYRHGLLRDISQEGFWGCSLSDRRLSFRRLLGPLACQPGGDIQAQHLILVVDRGNPKDQSDFVQQRLLEFGARIGLVATLGNSPSEGLERICREVRLPPPLVFRAELEIWYLLLQLNDRRRLTQSERREGHRLIPLNTAPKFQSLGSGPLSVLFTSSFSPGLDSSEQVAQAACDIGGMLESMPIGTRYEVDPWVTPERLASVLGEVKSPMIWVHIGHGLGPAGLEDAEREPVSPERWLNCFGGWKGSLPLVLFLACRSTPTAECFARAGAGVAIGFEGDVLSVQSRLLAVKVLDAALVGGGQRGPILEAFETGRELLEAVGSSSQPLTFYAEP